MHRRQHAHAQVHRGNSHGPRQRALHRLLTQWAKTGILVLDDLAMTPLTDTVRRDLLEVLDDRHSRRATIASSQVPVEHWHEAIGEPTVAEATLDRLVHNAHRITLTGESMRRRKSTLTTTNSTD